jgi:hypothetical protein
MSESPSYVAYLSFKCAECGFVIEPPNFGIAVFSPDLHGLSLKEAYQDRVMPQEIRDILTQQFFCELQQKFVHPPQIDAVFLVGTPRSDRSRKQ